MSLVGGLALLHSCNYCRCLGPPWEMTDKCSYMNPTQLMWFESAMCLIGSCFVCHILNGGTTLEVSRRQDPIGGNRSQGCACTASSGFWMQTLLPGLWIVVPHTSKAMDGTNSQDFPATMDPNPLQLWVQTSMYALQVFFHNGQKWLT